MLRNALIYAKDSHYTQKKKSKRSAFSIMMRCPYCENVESKVLDSRMSAEGRFIRRRRECLGCKRRYTTKEYVEESPLMVVKGDGRREVFDREKIRRGIQVACNKRPVSMESIEIMVDRIEAGFRDETATEVDTNTIGLAVLEKLRELDEVAYVRFASVYRKFQSKEEFISELRRLS